MTTGAGPRPTTIALAVESDRRERLLSELFRDHTVEQVRTEVPSATDICLVDEDRLWDLEEPLLDWRGTQEPLYAPVVLLVEPGVTDPWAVYEEPLRRLLDGIVERRGANAALVSEVETLLEMRAFSDRLATEQEVTEGLFETSPVAKLILDTDGRVRRANERAGTLLGRPPAALEGVSFVDGPWTFCDATGEPIPPAETPASRVLRTGQPTSGDEYRLLRPDDEPVWLAVDMAPLRDGAGAVEFVVGSLDDVSVRREQARELERQLDLFEKAQSIANVGAWEYDLRTETAHWSDEVYRIHGLNPETEEGEVSPDRSLAFYHPTDRPRVEAAFAAAVEEGDGYDLECRLIDDAGAERWVRTRGEPQRLDGEVVRIRGTLQDITERKERELELDRMRNAVDEAPIGVVISDPDREDNPLTYVNQAFLEVTGYDREAVLGRNCRFLQGEGTDQATVDEIRAGVAAEEPVSVVIRNYRADGTPFWNGLDIAPVRDEDGTVINFIGFQQDVTGRVERQRQLHRIDRYLRHNLRNKLNVVQGMAELVRLEGAEPMQEYASTIEQTTASLLTNVDKEREMTALLREQPTVVSVPLMDTLRNEIAASAAAHPAATISLSGPDEVQVESLEQLPTVFEELLANALDHHDGETPEVDVAVAVADETVVVRITDDGPGIPAMEVDVLTSLEEETDMYHSGGMGLWLVKMIVRRSGGTLEFGEGPAGGTTVTVRLPQADTG